MGVSSWCKYESTWVTGSSPLSFDTSIHQALDWESVPLNWIEPHIHRSFLYLIINVDYSISAIVCLTALVPSWQDKLSIGRMLPWNALECLHHQDKSKCAQLYSKLRCTQLDSNQIKSNMHGCIQNSNVHNCIQNSNVHSCKHLCTAQVETQTSRGCSIA